jgi:hypothetical protein
MRRGARRNDGRSHDYQQLRNIGKQLRKQPKWQIACACLPAIDSGIMKRIPHNVSHCGHTLMELVVAMVMSTMLLAGLAAVMFIASETAYAPTAAAHRTEAADVVHQICGELRHATLIIQQTPQMLEFVVADRNGDGKAEKICYQWSGTTGDPLEKRVNGGSSIVVLDKVELFLLELTEDQETTLLETTTDTAEGSLLANPYNSSSQDRDIRPDRQVAQSFRISSSGSPAGAIGWNATGVRFYGSKSSSDSETLLVHLRQAEDPTSGPTSQVLGQVAVAESTLSGGAAQNAAVFDSPVRRLSLDRDYALTWLQAESSGEAARLRVTFNVPAPFGVFESANGGASWHYWQEGGLYGQIYGEIRGSHILPGPTYRVTRRFAARAQVTLHAGQAAHSRVESAVPLVNRPERLTAYWRTDFEPDPNELSELSNPTAIDSNGDGTADWIMRSGDTFSTAIPPSGLGVWSPSGELRTNPGRDFTGVTIVEARCRGGAALYINADRQGGKQAPLTVRVTPEDTNSQKLTLEAKSAESVVETLCSVANLPGDLGNHDSFIQFRLMILPVEDLVNLQVNGEDCGTFAYPTYGPLSTDRFLAISGSGSEFDYVEIRESNDAVVEVQED